MKRLGFTLGLLLLSLIVVAQELPKAVEKVKKAVFSLVTYKDNQLLASGNGFFISEEGIGVADYTLFKGANRAVVVQDGKEYPIVEILGANEMYDVVKFAVQKGKKYTAIAPIKSRLKVGERIYMLPYATQKTSAGSTGVIHKVDSISQGASYYELTMSSAEKDVNLPIVNATGEVLAMLQKGGKEQLSYALGIDYVQALEITPLSIHDVSLQKIQIEKALPSTEEQALVYLYLASSQMDRTHYEEVLNKFLVRYPQSTEGYIRRANFYLYNTPTPLWEKAEQSLNEALRVSSEKSDVYYQWAQMIYNYSLRTPAGTEVPAQWQITEAKNLIEKAIDLKENAIYYQLKGDIYFAEEDYAVATTAYEKIIKLQPSPIAYYALARSKELTGTVPVAEVLALMDSTLAQYNKPYPVEAATYLYERGRIKHDAAMYREAVMDYNLFQEITGEHVTAQFYRVRAQAEMQCRMYAQALEDMKKATDMAPQEVELWIEKAGMHLRFNQREEAKKDLTRALSIGEQPVAQRMLGYILIEGNEKEKGLSLLKRAAEQGDTVATELLEKYK